MEAAGLCETIFEFMGPASRSEEEGVSQSSVFQAEGDSETHEIVADNVQHQQVQKEGMMLAFVGNKKPSSHGVVQFRRAFHQISKSGIFLELPAELGEYNLTGVEAGIAMVSVEKKTGKALNTKTRRKERVGQSPYKRRSIGEKKTNAS